MAIEKSENSFDAIVVGSGIGGLATASVLTQLFNKRVLLIEKHFVLGGFTHTFSRKGFTWDVGLHYVGQMAPNSSTRRAFDFITQGRIQWQKMKSPFEVFCYPNFRFQVSDNPQKYQTELAAQFPAEKEKLKTYFKEIKKSQLIGALAILPRWLRPLFKALFFKRVRRAKKTVRDYLNELNLDPKLASLLCSQWGDYGLPPEMASMYIHSVIVNHYLEGAYYPVGGAKVIAESIQKIIEEGRGQCLSKNSVESLILDENQILGVRVRNDKGEDRNYHAPLVFSDMGVQNLYKLIPKEMLTSATQNELQTSPEGTAAVVLYLGLKRNPDCLGIHGQNFWIYSDWDHDRIWRESIQLLDGTANHCYVSFPSMKDPTPHKPTAEVIAFIPYSAFAKWEWSSWRKRPEEYEQTKSVITKSLLNFVEKEIPGFRDLIDYVELSTPLTSEHFTSHPRGQIYGLPATPARIESELTGAKTPIHGLYNVGADVMGHGIVGAMMGSLMAIASTLGWSTLGKIMRPKQ